MKEIEFLQDIGVNLFCVVQYSDLGKLITKPIVKTDPNKLSEKFLFLNEIYI